MRAVTLNKNTITNETKRLMSDKIYSYTLYRKNMNERCWNEWFQTKENFAAPIWKFQKVD